MSSLERISSLTIRSKTIHLQDVKAKQDFHYHASAHFDPITKSIQDTIEKLLEKSKVKTKAIENFKKSHSLIALGVKKPLEALTNLDPNISLANAGKKAKDIFEIN